jgi:hypothetical protein
LRPLLRTHLLLLTLTPACSCDYFCKFQFRPIHPPSRRLSPPTPTRPAWKPRPTRHATGAPVATCEQLHRHSRHYRASSTAKPVPRLEATLRMTQQCQPGATVNTAKNGPAVMAVAGGRKQRSRRRPSLRPIQGQQGNPLPRHEDGAPVFRFLERLAHPQRLPPRTTRPVALTLRRDRRHLWQEKRATLHLRHNDRVKKVRHVISISYSFLFPLSLSYNRNRERGIP